MKEAIERDKPDENIVFFLPYPIVFSSPNSIFLQFAANYLNAIYDGLKENVDLSNRRIYIIYPSSKKNRFALKDMSSYYIEYIDYPELERYFSYEVVSVE